MNFSSGTGSSPSISGGEASGSASHDKFRIDYYSHLHNAHAILLVTNVML